MEDLLAALVEVVAIPQELRAELVLPEELLELEVMEGVLQVMMEMVLVLLVVVEVQGGLVAQLLELADLEFQIVFWGLTTTGVVVVVVLQQMLLQVLAEEVVVEVVQRPNHLDLEMVVLLPVVQSYLLDLLVLV